MLKKGAESELYLAKWYDWDAVSKIRTPKKYRNVTIDLFLRKYRTLHESDIMSKVKFFGINSPSIYFIDLFNFEIIMEYIQGTSLRDNFNPKYCCELGQIIGKLHSNNIIHGDITTSNFILTPNDSLVILDFGLSFYSERYEDKAADIRLFKEIMNSIHVDFCNESINHFFMGYKNICGKKSIKIFDIVTEIEKRGRYS